MGAAQVAPHHIYALPAPERWLSAEEALEATGWSAFWLREKAKSEEVISRESSAVSANGRRQREYLAASLPAEAKARLASADRSPRAVAKSDWTPLFAGQNAVTDLVRVALPDPAQQKQAEERLAILQPILDFAADPGRYRMLRLTDGSAVTSKSAMIAYQSAAHNVSRSTVNNWLKAWREGGFPALANRQRADKNTSRWFEAHRKAAYLAAWLYLDCRQSFRAIYEAIEQDAEMLDLGEDDLPSYETVRSWLRGLPPYLTTYAREGRAAYQNRMAPYLRRHYNDVAANQIWVSDHMIHDVEVMNDCFPEAPYGTPIRLRFTCLLDFRARYVVGASWCWEGSSRSIATAMRRAVMQHGPCAHFYCDNGKDYRKVAKGAVPAYLREPEEIAGWHEAELAELHQRGILARLGIKISHCIVRHPQSKHVERFFRTMHEQFDKRWHTYTAGAPHLRPDATSAAMMYHRKLLKHGRVEESLHPPASYFIALCMAWIEQYHQRPHSGEGMDGRTPAQVFAEERGPDGKRPAPEPRDLAIMLAEHKRGCCVRECAIEFRKHRYTYFDKESLDVLHSLNELEVTIAYDPLDLEAVAVLDEAGHFLCWAKAENFIDFNPADPEVQRRIGESMADRRHLEKQTRELVSGIARAARANGARNPVEMLAERAQVSPIVDAVLTHRAPRLRPDPEATAPASAADIAANFLEALK